MPTEVDVNPAVGIGPIIIALLVYLFSCFLLKRICEKAGGEPGILIWIPILQLIPLLNAAEMNVLWILAFFVPFLNVVATILMFWKLCEAMDKPGWISLFLLIPCANFLLLLYLAFME